MCSVQSGEKLCFWFWVSEFLKNVMSNGITNKEQRSRQLTRHRIRGSDSVSSGDAWCSPVEQASSNQRLTNVSSRDRLGKLRQSVGVLYWAFSPCLSFPWLNCWLPWPLCPLYHGLDTSNIWWKWFAFWPLSTHMLFFTCVLLLCPCPSCYRVRGTSPSPEKEPWI